MDICPKDCSRLLKTIVTPILSRLGFFAQRLYAWKHSRVRSKPSGTLINSGEKFHPRHVYSNHLYLNLKHFLLTPFIIDAFPRKIIKK